MPIIDAFPLDAVGEIHLGGHDAQDDDHGAAAADRQPRRRGRSIRSGGSTPTRIARTGPVPTLIEWDNDVPDWPVLEAEAARAAAVLAAVPA